MGVRRCSATSDHCGFFCCLMPGLDSSRSSEEPAERFAVGNAVGPARHVAHLGRGLQAEPVKEGGGQVAGADRIRTRAPPHSVAGTAVTPPPPPAPHPHPPAATPPAIPPAPPIAPRPP